MKEFMIKICGRQKSGSESDEIEMITVGNFFRAADSFIITYDESEATGFEGCKTTLKFEEQAQRLTMTRSGQLSSQLIIEKGRRHQCNYSTEAGSMTIGVSGSQLSSNLTEEGGELFFGYSLDINTALASENTVYITVNPQ